MKVKIGRPNNWFGPYQLAETICFWTGDEKPSWVHAFGDFLAHGFAKHDQNVFHERPESWLYRLLKWIHSKRQDQVSVRIDPWDTWNMYNTLAVIILPMLKQLKDTKHGSGLVDDEDVPEHLRSTVTPASRDGDIDENWFRRSDWVFDELIWTFEQLHPDCDWERHYTSGSHDWVSEPSEWDDEGNPILYTVKKGPNDTFKLDIEGMRKHQDRIDNGLRLFGKYFQNLWD